jgi:transcriptional regulator with XRE-family HTH domain
MDAKDFWARVRPLIKKNNTTQAEIAKVCGLSLNTLHGWMFKGIFPPVIDAYNIAHMLGVSVDYLVAGRDMKEQRTEANIEGVKNLLHYAEARLDKMMP